MDADEAVLRVLDRCDHRRPAASRFAVVERAVQPDRLGDRAEDQPAAEIGFDQPVRRLGFVPDPSGGRDTLRAVASVGLALALVSCGIGSSGRFVDQSATVQLSENRRTAASGETANL